MKSNDRLINNIDRLNEYIGVLLSYKQICNILEIEYTNSNSKKKQLKLISCYYEIEKINNKYKILKRNEVIKKYVYRDKKDIVDTRYILYIYDTDYKDINKNGIYAIVLDNNIYIGSTIRVGGFKERLRKHLLGEQEHTKQLLDNGGKFQILLVSEIEDEYIIREIEQTYIDYFANNNDWNIVNRREDTIVLSQKSKYKTKIIKVDERLYDKAITILRDNNVIK